MVKGKEIHTKKWKRCVRKVKSKQANPYAVCTASLGKRSFLKKAKHIS